MHQTTLSKLKTTMTQNIINHTKNKVNSSTDMCKRYVLYLFVMLIAVTVSAKPSLARSPSKYNINQSILGTGKMAVNNSAPENAEEFDEYDDEYETIAKQAGPRSIPDPWEKANRKAYKLNNKMDIIVVNNLIATYRKMPGIIKTGLTNTLFNISEPRNAFNFFLQKKPREGFASIWRCLINTTIGLGGTLDVANELGLEKQYNDFAKTLARYNAPPGPYIVIPFMGPASARNALGLCVDVFLDPLLYLAPMYVYRTEVTLTLIQAKNKMSDFEKMLRKNTLDPYVSLKSAFAQFIEEEQATQD